MSNIKKPFQPLVSLLQANPQATVEEILPKVLELATAATVAVENAQLYDEQNNIYAVYCFYHKKWELLSAAEYGTKSSSKTGLNSMCKEGVRQWTKRNKAHKDGMANLLTYMFSDEAKQYMEENNISETELLALKKAELEQAKSEYVPREDGHGWDYDDMEEVKSAHQAILAAEATSNDETN